MKIKEVHWMRLSSVKKVYCLRVKNARHEVVVVGQSGTRYRCGQSINFGLLYGGSHLVLQNSAKYKYGVDMTEEEAIVSRRKFFRLYPNLLVWHESVKVFIARHGYVLSPMGRPRHLPGVFIYQADSQEYGECIRQGLNAPVQGTCADFLGQVWCYVENALRIYKMESFAVLTVHDSLVWETTEGEKKNLMDIHTEAVQKYTEHHKQRGWLLCDMTIDFEAGPSWGELKGIK